MAKNEKVAPVAPKNTENKSEVVAPVANEQTQPVAPVAPVDQAQENLKSAMVTPPVEKTIEELRAEAKAAALAAIETEGLSEEEALALSLKSYKANKAVMDKINGEKAKIAQAEIEAKKVERAAEVDKLIELYIASQAAQLNDALTLDEKNVIYNQYKDHLQYIKNEHVKTMTKTLVVPAGMSGKTLQKAIDGDGSKKDATSVSGQIRAKLDEGLSVDEIEALGIAPRKRISDVKWHWEKEQTK